MPLLRSGVVCTENLIRVDDGMESPKLTEWSGCSVSLCRFGLALQVEVAALS
jgi:hypothetical protein